jgi:hypothetical protein
MGSHPVRAPDFEFVGPAYWIPVSELLRTLISPNAWPLTNTSVPNILAQLSAEKQWVEGGGGAKVGACITLAPQYQY